MNISNECKIRAVIIERIINDEEDYLRTLNFIVDVLKPDLTSCSEQIQYEIDEGHVRALFGNVSELVEVHVKLLAKIKEALKDVAVNGNALQMYYNVSIGEIYDGFKESFNLYEIYCCNFARSEQVTNDVIKMTSLNPIFEKWKSKNPFLDEQICSSTVLQYSLMDPLKYLSRLSVLLKCIAVFTSHGSPNLSHVIKAYKTTHCSLGSIESMLRKKLLQEAYRLCDVLQRKWQNDDLGNKDGFLTKRGGSVKTWKIRWFKLRGFELKYFDEPVDEKALSTLDIREAKAIIESDTLGKPNCFGLVFSDRTYYMYATSPRDEMKWVNLIGWKIFILKSTEERAEQALKTENCSTALDML